MTPIDKAIAALENIATLTEKDPRDSVIKYHADQALTELKAARQSGVPDGWVVVPREPTEEIEGLDEAIEHFKYTTVVNWSDPTVSKMFEALKEAAKRYQGRGG